MSRKTKLLAVALTAIMVLSVFAYAPAATEASTAGHDLTVDDSFTEYNDDDDGDNQFKTIQAAVDDAQPGDVIKVMDGTYDENVMVNKSVVLNGAGVGSTTLVGNATGMPSIVLGADNIELRNFRVEAPSDGAAAIAIYDLIDDSYVQGVLVENNRFVGDDDTDTLGYATPPTSSDLSRHLTIRDNTFTGGTPGTPSMDVGFNLDARDSVMEDNTFNTKVEVASLLVDGPNNVINNTNIKYPGIAVSGMYIEEGGENTQVNTLTVDGHGTVPHEEHIHEDETRGDWVVWGVYVDGDGSTLTDVDSHESHVGIYVGGEQRQDDVSDVTILDSVADDNLNHDLQVQADSHNIHVENFDADSAARQEGTQADKYKDFYPTYGANVLVQGGEDHSLVDVTSTNEFPVGIAMLDTDDSLVDQSEIRNKGPGEATLNTEDPFRETTGVMLANSDDNTISNSLVSENDVGIAILDGEGNSIVDNNPTGEAADQGIYNNTDAGIRLDDAPDTHIENNDVRRNGIGLDVSDSNVRALYNNFVDNGDGIVAGGGSEVDARWNWFGADNGPSGSATDGVLSGSGDSIVGPEDSFEYDPFLTAPKDQVQQDPDKTKQFAHDLVTNGSQGFQTFGTPAPANISFQTSQGSNAMFWTYDDGSWSMLSSPMTSETLRGFVVTNLQHNEHARVVIDLSDDGPAAPGMEGLEDGWNLVASPQYGHAEDVITTSSTIRKTVSQSYDQFDSQPFSYTPPVTGGTFTYTFGSSVDDPVLSAYAGYWVFVDGSGDIVAAVPPGVTISEEGGNIVA